MKGFRHKSRNRQRYDWFNVKNEDRRKWESLCPPGEYRILPREALSGILPEPLINKFANFFIMASGTSSGNVYYMANGNRVDFNDNAVDQMPFGLAFVGDNPIASGCFIQHGDWENRTTTPPNEFWLEISSSRISTHYPLSELPTESSGKIVDLKIDSQHHAFSNIVNTLKEQVGE
jgi:hypothetical protein